ncbi:acyltransferase [Edaphobacter paludis]|uniref:Acyltransferase n=1 Tax=Edaphobacter paludis TaxID=3035702 RepID=A0AAU7DAK0_9BACT
MSHSSRDNSQRNHQFDLLRIFFATFVLLAHAPELTDGNQKRELFVRLTHAPITFGGVGVNGFFLLSGFLIVKSWQQNPDLLNFLRNRFLRIVPGYLVAAFLSTLIVGLLAPGIAHFFRHIDIHCIKSILVLSSPATPPVLPGLPHPLVNGALWTIQYEVRCYILVALYGICGLFRRPAIWLGTTVLLLLSTITPALTSHFHWSKVLYPILGDPAQVFRLTAIYFVGGCFFLFRQQIRFRPHFAFVACAILLCIRTFNPSYIEMIFTVFGGYLMFYFGQMSLKSIQWMKNFPDISYGIYIYGWPVLSLWIWYRHGSPWVAFLGSTAISFGLGWMSWHFIERPMLTLKRKNAAPLPLL